MSSTDTKHTYLHKVLKGVYGFIIFWIQKGQFQGEHRGGFQSPPPNRIFLTPRQLGLKGNFEIMQKPTTDLIVIFLLTQRCH